MELKRMAWITAMGKGAREYLTGSQIHLFFESYRKLAEDPTRNTGFIPILWLRSKKTEYALYTSTIILPAMIEATTLGHLFHAYTLPQQAAGHLPEAIVVAEIARFSSYFFTKIKPWMKKEQQEARRQELIENRLERYFEQEEGSEERLLREGEDWKHDAYPRSTDLDFHADDTP